MAKATPTRYTIHTVQGQKYMVWSDFNTRSTYAQNMSTLETRRLCGSGYIHKDLTVRKAIATAYGLNSFRK